MNQAFSKIWIAIILAVVGIMAIVGGGFYAWQKSTKPSITLLSPNGGEIWTIGSTYTIRWTSQNIPQTDKISIHIRRVPPPPLPETGQEFDPIIFIELENTGSVNWTISDMYPVGNYIIEVNSYPSIPITKVISDESDASFRIESSSDEIADWKVYRNEGYGFEVKYPPVWELSEKTEILPSIRLEPAEKHFKVEISFFVISPELEFAGIPRTEREGAPEAFWQEKTRIENCSNKKIIGNTEFCIEDFACFEGAKLTEYLTINQNKNLIVKSYFTHSSGNFLKCLSDNEVKIELSDFNQILSTFKFIER